MDATAFVIHACRSDDGDSLPESLEYIQRNIVSSVTLFATRPEIASLSASSRLGSREDASDARLGWGLGSLALFLDCCATQLVMMVVGSGEKGEKG